MLRIYAIPRFNYLSLFTLFIRYTYGRLYSYGVTHTPTTIIINDFLSLDLSWLPCLLYARGMKYDGVHAK